MFRNRIIYRLITAFLVFALLTLVPFAATIVKHVDRMIMEEEAARPLSEDDEYAKLHREFSSRLLEQMVPYAVYIFILAFMLSIFFMRKMLISLKQLRQGSRDLQEGRFDISLEVCSEDELGDVTKAFNDMALALKKKTAELKEKDNYVNAMLDPLWVVDQKNTITDINPAFTRLFGHERDQVIGASVYDFLDEKNAQIVRQQLDEKREKGLSSIYEVSILARDGSQIPVLISGSPIFSGEKIVGKIGILKDFRDQHELRNQLEQSKEYTETVMDSIQDEILVVDREYRIIRSNQVALLHAKGPVTGKFCHVLFHNSELPCWAAGEECPAKTVFLTGRTHQVTHLHTDLSGNRRFHDIVASPVRDASGNVIQVIELRRDVTERITHEEEISRKNRELVALNSIAGLLGKSLRPDEIFTRVLDRIVDLLNMEGGGIFFIDDTKKEMYCKYHKGISDEYVKMMGRVRLGEDIPGRVAVTGQIMTTPDVSRDNRVDRSLIKHSGIRGYCCIPIRGKERVIGVFCLFSYRPHLFTVEEENILSAIGEMTGIAFENISLYEKMRELYDVQRRRREEEHAQLLSLSAKLGSAVELEDVLEQILDHLKNSVKANFIWLLLQDSAGNLVLSSSTAKGPGRRIVYQSGISTLEGHAIETLGPAILSRLQSAERYFLDPDIEKKGYQSVVSIPLIIGRKAIGAYTIYYLESRELREEEIHFLEIIANMLAVALQRSELYHKAIMEKGFSDTVLQSVIDGIIAVSAEGRVLSLNKAVEHITGRQTEYAAGMPLCDLFRYNDENAGFRILMAECLEISLSGSAAGRESELIQTSGRPVTVLISSAPIRDAEGRVIAAVIVLRDISREKEIDKLKTDLIRSVSHEFRTPLSAIVGMTEMVLHGDVGADRAPEYLRTIMDEGIRLSHMVSDLLNIARIESGKEKLIYQRVDFNKIVAEAVRQFSAVIEQKMAVVSSIVESSVAFSGDEEKLTQIIANLIENSLTFSDPQCIIKMRVRDKAEGIEIVVSDNGWGIPAAELPHLTERFFRGKHGEKVKGTGLGLSLCREIVKMHGGTLDIRSEPGKGTEVSVYLPSKVTYE